ncbi:MAG: acyltransferase [Gemmatimonadota bacterium]|nr:acyltransferase [Gemmatimonadota bacterium]
MVQLPLRAVPVAPDAEAAYDEWIRGIDERLADPGCDRNALVAETLRELFFPALPADVDASRLPAATRAALASLDPRGVTLEPEHYRDIDPERYAPRKPLIWLWQMFDRSPLGGNVTLGVRFRRMLAPHVFKRVGRNFKAFHFVEVSFGYNLEVGDDVVVHRDVLLDDRGGIVIGNRVSISDRAAVFSHTHSIDDINDVTCMPTVLGDDVRITYGATVLAGVHVGTQGMVGARALATRNVRPFHVNVGIPAKSVRVKGIAPRELQPGVSLPTDSGER